VDLARATAGAIDFWDVMSDLLSEEPTRHPGYLLHLLAWLPDDGAIAAVHAFRRAEAEAHGTAEKLPEPKPNPRDWFGWGVDRHLQAAHWDLMARVNAGKGKPPTYPRPQVKKAKPVSPWQAQYEAVRAKTKRPT
jgi:hypothetical protein